MKIQKSKFARNILSFVGATLLMSFALGVLNMVLAAAEPVPILDEILKDSGLQNFSGRYHQLSNVEPGADVLTSIIFTVIDFAKYLLGGVAVIYVIVSGIKLIVAGKKIDEVSEKEKENLKYIIYGLILIITADELITKVFFGEYGECVASATNAAECAKVGGSLIKGIYGLILSVMATVAIFVLVVSAFRLITSAGEEESIGKQKKRITMAIVGLIIAAMGEFVVKGIVFPSGGTKGIDVAAAQKLVANLTSFIAAFIGAGAFAMLFYGGYLYVISVGNDEKTGKAKKIIIGAIIGILIALAAFGIVTTLTSFTSGREINLPGRVPGLPGGAK